MFRKFFLFLQISLLGLLLACAEDYKSDQDSPVRLVPNNYPRVGQPYYQSYQPRVQYYQPYHQVPVIPTAQVIPASRYYANPYDIPPSPYHNVYDADHYYVPPANYDYGDYNGYVTPGPF